MELVICLKVKLADSKKSPVGEINRKLGKSLRCILNVIRRSPVKTQLDDFKIGIVA